MKQKSLTSPLKLLIIVVVALVSVSVCTLLHLIPSTYATNNPVDIELVEMSDDGSGNLTPWQDIIGAMPGETYSAIPQVINRGTEEVTVRICLTRSGQSETGDPIEITENHISVTLEPGWDREPNTDCYNYNSPLTPGATTDPLFSSVTIKETVSDEHQNATFNLHIYAEATTLTPTSPPDTGFTTNLNEFFSSPINIIFTAFVAALIISPIVFRIHHKLIK